jgi:chromate transporter
VSFAGLSWDLPVLSSLDPWMAALSAIALIAVFRFHLGLGWLLGGAALAGMALKFVQ